MSIVAPGFWRPRISASIYYSIVSMMKTGGAGNTSMWNHSNTSNSELYNFWHGNEHPSTIDQFDSSNNGNGVIVGAPFGPIYVNDFSLSDRYLLLAWNKTWILCNARIKLDFLTSSDSLVIGLKTERNSSYSGRLYWTTDGSTYNDTGTAQGTYQSVCGDLTFDSSNIYFTADTSGDYSSFGYVGTWSKAIDLSAVTKIKVYDCYLNSDYSGNNAIVYVKFGRKNVTFNIGDKDH